MSQKKWVYLFDELKEGIEDPADLSHVIPLIPVTADRIKLVEQQYQPLILLRQPVLHLLKGSIPPCFSTCNFRIDPPDLGR